MNERVLICGGRDYADELSIHSALLSVLKSSPIEVVIHGAARGADTLAAKVAAALSIPTLRFPADWERYGRAAGAIRNARMLVEGKPTLVLAFPTRKSRGTWDMVSRARRVGISAVVNPPESTT